MKLKRLDGSEMLLYLLGNLEQAGITLFKDGEDDHFLSGILQQI